ncbi:MAG: SDR family NAD(P)-dependent oxidoreductase [Nitrospiraceae bacterium]|nr:SDR family NAD(P)-dependent oxidoreductase [Nitrospiraceae bacterium]
MAEKVVFVTGGTGGFGSVLAHALAKKGYNVGFSYLKNEAKARDIENAWPGRAAAYRADVSDFENARAMAKFISDKWGRLDALINCAGITRDGLLVKTSIPDWQEVMDVNLKGVFNCVKACLPLLIDSGGGHIINISSYSGVKGKKGQAAYSASKAALIGLTVGASAELGQYGIKVNAVLPGYMPTGMGPAAGEAMEKAKQDSMLGALSSPEDAAGIVVSVLETSSITGQVFPVESRVM